MPQITFDAKTGEATVQGEITSITVNPTGAISTVKKEIDGVTTTTITFSNGGTVKSTPNGNGFDITANGVLLSYSDDPESEGNVILNIKMDKTVE